MRHARSLVIAFGLNLAILVAEVVGSFLAHSLSLLADAGHMLIDAGGLGMTLVAIWLARRPPTTQRTFGYYRLEILAAVANSVLLFGIGLFVLIEAIDRLVTPVDVHGTLMLAFGALALVGNGIGAWLLRRGSVSSLAIESAFLDMLADTLGALSVVVAGAIIAATGFDRADPIASLLIAGLILPRTWRLLRRAVDVLLEATPEGVDLQAVRRHILETPGVISCHDLHAWTITSGMPVLSVHVVTSPDADGPLVLDALGECLKDHFDIEHSTFQLESAAHREREPGMHD
jgi:cobalt-zinc-cadmium efflux system protein